MGELLRLTRDFFARDVLEVAPDLPGKLIAHRTQNGILRLRISEAEAYRGEQDTACHAHRGRTRRTEVLYGPPGTLYVYLCYGIHWMLNVVTGREGQPQAALVRACLTAEGPGKLTKALQITGTLNGQDAVSSPELWLEDDGLRCRVAGAPRVGIGYASPEDRERLWRFVLLQDKKSKF